MPRTTKTTAKDKAPHTVPPEEHTANTGRPDATAATQLNKKSWAQNHRAATEQDVRYELEDYYSFLHFLALYCKPMLDKIKGEYRLEEPQPTPIYLTGFEHLTEQEAELVKKKGSCDKHIVYFSSHYWGWWYR